jgi:hypothetical protein
MEPKLTEQFLIEHKTPLDFLIEKEEPEAVNHYREASQQFLRVLKLALLFITKSKSPKLAAYGVAYALEVFPLVEQPQRSRARELEISHGTISAYTSKFKKELQESQ